MTDDRSRLWGIIEARDEQIKRSERRLADVAAQLVEKERTIQVQSSLLESQREELEQCRALFFMSRWAFKPFRAAMRTLYGVVKPKLGRLRQHSPRCNQNWCDDYIAKGSYDELPLISIVVPSYNQAAFLPRTLASIFEQSYGKIEVHVQDGRSLDNTQAILQRIREPRLSWDSRADNGQAQAINRGFALTGGEIMAWLNSDDILLPGALSYVAEFFRRHPEVDVVYGHRVLIDEDDCHIGDWIMPAHNDAVLSWADFVPQETLFWRRRIWEKAGGGLDESFRFALDWELLIRFRDVGARFVRVPRLIGGFRVHPQQKTSTEISSTGSEEMDRIRLRALGRIPTKAEIQKALFPYVLRHVISDIHWRFKKKLHAK